MNCKSLNKIDKGKSKPDGGTYPPSQKGAVRAMDDVDVALSQGAKRNNAGAANQAKRQLEFMKIWIKDNMLSSENYLDNTSMEVGIAHYVNAEFEKDLRVFLGITKTK